jgi:Ca-activated chloride channel family protein
MVNVAKREATVMLVSDTSGSMQADDVGPTRLVAARDAAKGFVDRTPGRIKLGLVTFNSTSQLLVPPTNDRDRVKGTLDTMHAGGGTAIGSAIDTALAGLKQSLGKQKGTTPQDKKRPPPAVVVLLSDGKSTIGTAPLSAARRAHALGVPVNTVALGTNAAVIQVNDPLGGFRSVPVPPDPATLKKIAQTTGGRFFAAKDAKHLGDIYKNLGRRIGFKRERRDLTPAFAGGGLVLMLSGGLLSLMWFGRLP